MLKKIMTNKKSKYESLYRIIESKFVYSADSPAIFPPQELPEVCIIGRSNVGKSSMINELLQRKKLARVGKTPGVTKVLCFYELDYKKNGEEADQNVGKGKLVDLPGYGYAKTGGPNRNKWSKLITAYLGNRECLQAVILLLDIRRQIGDEEKDILALSKGEGVLIGITKSDKLSQKDFQKRRTYFLNELGVEEEGIFFLSTLSAPGQREVDRLRDVIIGCYEPIPLS